MNHVYKTIWNEQTGTFVAVSENKTAKGKRSSSCVKGESVRLCPLVWDGRLV